ncbi:PAS domain-containing protein [Salipiger sp. IMCC34102]|uniref:PAS-domain containing protein n=1 Tax=Salipiger sp. IMCC34102 TaxID=2510647 RepID=UPI00101C4522|nr:PAS-domain containing protein [Salipiger sp. IMCC34102]RYH04236.1 PAS domain-containing protein [Salipiger sp. IMCC34102]
MTDVLTVSLAFALLLNGLFGAAMALRGNRRAIANAGPRGAANGSDTPVFLFDGDFLVDASPSASALIADRGTHGEEMETLLSILSPRFPQLRQRMAKLRTRSTETVRAEPPDGTCVQVRDDDGLTRISLRTAEAGDSTMTLDALEREAEVRELDLLRAFTRETPQLIWQEDPSGNLTWANDAYLAYADRTRPAGSGGDRIWPGSRLFKDLDPLDPDADGPITCRQSLRLNDEDVEHWFDVTARRLDDSTIFFAADVNATVRAEHARHEFLQTLAKTFAQLSTGLAIFDKQRRLTMFNPALLDMFDLPFSFMSTRPTLEAILDRLREMRKLPEPKDYIGWRDGFVMLETGESGGIYAERWHLPDGLTFRVTGRPHPDGATAFLFEDISAEVSLTQRFRTEIETGQAVLDEIEDAIAVFSNANTLVMTNQAYGRLWQDTQPNGIEVQDLRAALRTWRSRSTTAGIWRRIEAMQAGDPARGAVDEVVILKNGRQLHCKARRIAGGMTLVRFCLPELTLGADHGARPEPGDLRAAKA